VAVNQVLGKDIATKLSFDIVDRRERRGGKSDEGRPILIAVRATNFSSG
jgi:hypothetical protein